MPSAGADAEGRGHSHVTRGMPNYIGPLENGLSISYTVKHGVIMSPSTANPGYFLEK